MSKTYRNRRKRTEYTKSAKVPILPLSIGGLILMLVVMVGCRSTPTPQKHFTAWKVFELRKDLRGDYDKAWEAIVEAVGRKWVVKNRDKESGYIQTGWTHSETHEATFRTRLVILLQFSAVTFKMRAEPQRATWYGEDGDANWFPDTDGVLRSRTYYDLVNEVGRTVLNEY